MDDQGPAPPDPTQLPPSWSCADSRGLRLLLLRSMSLGFHHCQINGSDHSGGMLVAARFAGPTGLALGTQSGPRPLESTWTQWEAASYPWGQLSDPATEGRRRPWPSRAAKPVALVCSFQKMFSRPTSLNCLPIFCTRTQPSSKRRKRQPGEPCGFPSRL